MATGSTADHALTRNDIIASALRKVKGWPEDGNPPVHKIREAIAALNNIIRAEDLKQTSLAKSLWAMSTVVIPVTANRWVYGEDEDLPAIRELEAVHYRDVNGHEGSPLDIITGEAYVGLTPKNDTGVPQKVYLKRSRLLADQKLYIWPAPSSVTSPDTVYQDDNEYTCILEHTSASENKPNSGASWEIFWKLTDTETGQANTWATATEYTTGESLVLHFKRPLYDFDSAYDNPDFPLGWEDYLIYRLAIRLAPEYDLSQDRRQMLKQDLAEIELEIFPSKQEKVNTLHNKAKYF